MKTLSVKTTSTRIDFRRKCIISLALILVVIVGLCLQSFDFIRPITNPLHAQLDESLQETALTFATTRAVNAVISLVQESTFGFSLGINFSIAAGQILDPLNDLIERFSQLTLACLVALSLQKVLLDLGIVLALSLLLPLTAILALTMIWWRGAARPALRHITYGLGLISLFTLLGLPISILGTDALDHLLLSKQIVAANSRINQVSTDLAKQTPSPPSLNEDNSSDDDSLFDRFKRSAETAQTQVEQPAKILTLLEQIKSLDTETLVEDIILLCGLYLLRALLLPILMLWLTFRLGLLLITAFDPMRWENSHAHEHSPVASDRIQPAQ
jgi:hypothetical protein